MEAGNGSISPSQTNSAGLVAGRKEGTSPSHLGTKRPRRQFSLSALLAKMKRYYTRSRSVAAMSQKIPEGLLPAEVAHYRTLIDLVDKNPWRYRPRVVVITDLAKDYDDLAAMVVLKELDRIGVVELLGFVANLMPADRRVQFGRGALNLLGLSRVPIRQGTSGFPVSATRKHNVLDYEFRCDFMVPDAEGGGDNGGQEFLLELCQNAKLTGNKFTLLLISSLEDIYTFSKNYPDALKDAVSNIILQGGYTISSDGNLEPDEAANNNRYDLAAAKEFHKFIQIHNIPSTVYTKVAAFATSLTSELFAQMADTGHKLGVHLRRVQVEQDLSFYIKASNENEDLRFAKFMDQKWFLENKTSWFENNGPDVRYPIGEAVVPWLTKVVVYDALAALGTSGDDALNALNVLTSKATQPTTMSPHSLHQIVGFAGRPSDPGVHTEQMTSVLSALLKGSLNTSLGES